MRWIVLLMALIGSVTGSAHIPVSEGWRAKTENADYIHRAIKQVTDVMVYDIYSPPVTSRTYAYVSVAAYETLIQGNPDYISLAGQLHGLKPIPEIDKQNQYSLTLAAVHAILTSGKHFVISEERIEAFEIKMFQEFKESGIPDAVFDNSVVYGQQVADHILAWAGNDKYKQIKAMPDY